MTLRRIYAAVCAALILGAAPAAADVTMSTSTPSAESAIGTRIGALMGVEATSLSGLSRDRIRRLGAPPSTCGAAMAAS